MNFLEGVVEDAPSEDKEIFVQKIRGAASNDLEFLQSAVSGLSFITAIVRD